MWFEGKSLIIHDCHGFHLVESGILLLVLTFLVLPLGLLFGYSPVWSMVLWALHSVEMDDEVFEQDIIDA